VVPGAEISEAVEAVEMEEVAETGGASKFCILRSNNGGTMRFLRVRSFYLPLLLGLLFVAGFIFSCTAQSREESIKEFLGYLKENNEKKIYAVSYHVNAKNYIMDSALRKQYVAYASECLHTYRMSPRTKWYTEEISGGTSWLYIPLFAGNDTTTAAVTITLRFPPPAVSNKVYNFTVVKRDNQTKGVIEAPKRVH
jgi:hypothetical protein